MPVSKFFALVTSLGEGIDCFKSGSTPCGLCDFLHVGQNFFYMLLEIGLVAAVGVIVYGAIMLIVSHGSEDLLKKGKGAITGAVIGMILALGGWVIINTVFFILTGASGSWSSMECIPSEVITTENLPTSTEPAGFMRAKVATNGQYRCDQSTSSDCNKVTGACANAYCFSLADPTLCGKEYPSSSLKEVYGYKRTNEIFAHCYGTLDECTNKQPKQPASVEYNCRKVFVDNFSDIAGTGQCSVAPLTTQAPSLGVHWSSSNSNIQSNLTKLKTEFNKMWPLLGQLGINTDATSVYRPLKYQEYLYEISEKSKLLGGCDNSDTAVRNNCTERWNEVCGEKQSHGLLGVVGNPGTCGSGAPHTRGIGIDIVLSYADGTTVNDYDNIHSNNNTNSYTINGKTLDLGKYKNFKINSLLDDAGIDLRWQNISGDKVHFNLQNYSFKGCALESDEAE